MKLASYIRVFILTCLLQQAAFAQRYRQHCELFNTRSGLPNNAILSMVQDNRGLLWIGTRNGLCLYDGHHFEIKKNLFGKKEMEWENIFWCLFKDKRGDIWMSTQAGHVAVYNGKTGTFATLNTTQLQPGEFVTTFFQCNDRQLLAGSNQGNLFLSDISSHDMKKIATIFESIRSVECTQNRRIVLNGNKEITLPPGLTSDACECSGHIVVTPGRIDVRRSATTVRIIENEILRKRNYTLLVTDTQLFMATTRMVKEFDMNGHMRSRIIINDEDDDDNEDVANFLFEDRTGILWLGTNAGLMKIDKAKYRFTNFGTGTENARLNSNYVRSVLSDSRGNTWVGFKTGYVNRIRQGRTTGKFAATSCRYMDGRTSQSAINVIRELRSGTIMFGGSEGLFYIPRKETSATAPMLRTFFPPVTSDNERIEEVWSIFEDRAGKLWVGTRGNGLFVIDVKQHRCRRYPYTTANGLSSVWQIFEDSHKGIWLCTQTGVDSVYTGAGGYPESFYNLHHHYTGNPGSHVWSVTEDNEHRLWIGTTDNGISMVDKQKRTFITFDQKDGLSGNAVCGLMTDGGDRLWISTMNGLTSFDIKSHDVWNYDENDGLPGNDFNFNACCKSPEGKMLFGSKNGLTVFDPALIRNTTRPGASVIVRPGGPAGQKQLFDYGLTSAVTLAYNANSLDLRFAIPDYTCPGNHRYKYMLQGFDDRWNVTDARNPVATYTNIPPGRYSLVVSGSSDGQTWNTDTTEIEVVVRHAFWQKPAFIFSGTLLGILALGWFVRNRFRRSIRKEKEKHAINQKFAELELRALQAQMNPHFVFNAINAVQHFMLCNDELSANAYLSRFARLMRFYFESSNKKYILLCEEIELLKLYVSLEKLRFEDKFDYCFTIAPGIEHSSLEIPSMLLQPFVENAINHGLAQRKDKGQLNISFWRHNNSVFCVIDDNGVGRKNAREQNSPPKKKHTSSDAIRERLAAYLLADNVEVTVSVTDKTDPHGNSDGTTVQLKIPELI